MQRNDLQEISDVGMPAGLAEQFAFVSCIKQQDGREAYFVTQKSVGKRAVLRVADSDSGENATA